MHVSGHQLSQYFLEDMTGLHVASIFGLDALVVELLLRGGDGGEEVDFKDGYGQTPLWHAAERGHEAAVKLPESKA